MTALRRTATCTSPRDMPGVEEGRITQIADPHDVIDAHEAFDQRRPGLLKVALDPVSA